jgi:hypothetical protein
MRPAPLIIGFNEKWAKKVGKEKFLKHFKDIYPGHDLNAEWDKISPPKKEDKKEDKS